MTKLETINAEDLQNRTYEPTPLLVDELIPEGLHIHHLRKLHDDDPMNMISGSTGLSGAADSAFVLQKKCAKRQRRIPALHRA